MHHHKYSELHIGTESLGLFSDSTSTFPPLSFSPNTQLQLHPRTQTTSTTTTTNTTTITNTFTPNQTRFSLQVPSFSSSSQHPPNPRPPPPPPPQQNNAHTLFHHERFSNNPSQTPLSSPHKRPLMTHSFSPPPPTHHNHTPTLHTQSSSPSFSCYPSFPTTPFCTKFPTLKLLITHYFRFLIFLSLPSLYFLLSNPYLSFVLDFFSVITFSTALLITLNLALPRFPSIRLFFTRSLPSKLSSSFSASNSPQPVLWSIGSKPNPLKTSASGLWVQVYSNGDVYEGEFHKGKCWGRGVYHYHLSGRYEGDWVDGKYDGYGVETWARGSRYRGEYRQGLRHGVGIYRFYSGDGYAGEWSNGQCHGFGVRTCNDGSRYVGEFKWGVKHGLGRYHFRNGDIYAGEYFADKMHGFGVYQFQNGHLYEGAWHEGRRQGLGRYTFRSGETQCGHWQNGILGDPKMQNSHTGSPCAVDHAKVLNAVQDAHCAAEKAYKMATVDEGVNKVVAAANKAANAARVAAVKAVQNRMHHHNNNDDK